jgi:hypothetical protein
LPAFFAAFDRVKRRSTFSGFSSGIGGSLVLEAAGACFGLPAAGACFGTPAFTTLTIFTMFQLKLTNVRKTKTSGEIDAATLHTDSTLSQINGLKGVCEVALVYSTRSYSKRVRK